MIKCFLLATSPPPFGNVLLTVNVFFLVSLIDSSKDFKCEMFWLYVTEPNGAFLGEAVVFLVMWRLIGKQCPELVFCASCSLNSKLLDLAGGTKT